MAQNNELRAERIQETIRRLGDRIHERFPDSSLRQVCHTLYEISVDTDRIVRWIRKPNHVLRCCVYLLLLIVVVMLALYLARLDLEIATLSLADVVAVTDAGLNSLVLIGAGVFFLVSLEARRKRKRVTNAIHDLRSIAHIVDAHQLTKDPDRATAPYQATPNSPSHGLTPFELGRYLDYCSEMLSLIGKTAFLYVQHFDDPVASNAAGELETLTTALSRKIWQKILVSRTHGEPAAERT